MATHKGCEGIVKVGDTPTVVGEVTDWTIDEKAEVIDASAIGDCNRKKDVGPLDWSGSINAHWDAEDDGQIAIGVGTLVVIDVYPSGEESGDTHYTGTGIITGINRSGGFDGLVKAGFSFEGTGTLTESQVV